MGQWAKLARTGLLHALQVSDQKKWKDYQFPTEWEMRLKRIAEILPAGSQVFEFGAGPVGLGEYLDPSCKLTSTDLVEHLPGMKILDLNRRPLPDLGGDRSRIAVFPGVLEYVSDLASLSIWVARHFEMCVASYECAEPQEGIFGRARETVGRTHLGWVNHYTEAELKALFAAAGFQLTGQTTWGTDDPGQIFVFRLRGN